jgi:hypothetical protein
VTPSKMDSSMSESVRAGGGGRGDVRDEGGGGAELSGLMWAAVRLELGFQVCRGRMTPVTSSEYRGCSGEGLARQWGGWPGASGVGWAAQRLSEDEQEDGRENRGGTGRPEAEATGGR